MSRLRIMGLIWLIGSLPVGFFGLLIIGLSGPVEGVAGVVLLVLAALAVPIGLAALLGQEPSYRRQRVSLAVSVLWILASIFTTLSFDFPEDRWVAGGIPAAIGILTAVLALSALGRRPPGRSGLTGSADTW
jgi:hypothetical protein